MANPSPTSALHAAVLAIPDGQVSETAREAGLALTALLRLRRGEALNIRIATLARLAKAMGRSTDELLGLREPPPNARAEAALRQVAALMAEKRRRLEKERAEVEKQLKRLTQSEDET